MAKKTQTVVTPANRRDKIVSLLKETREKLKEVELLFLQEQMQGYLGKVREALTITKDCYISFDNFNEFLKAKGR